MKRKDRIATTLLITAVLLFFGFATTKTFLRTKIEARTSLKKVEKLKPDSCDIHAYYGDSTYTLYYDEYLVIIYQDEVKPFEKGGMCLSIKNIEGDLICFKWEREKIWKSDMIRVEKLKALCLSNTLEN